jgi:mono/diheme cytochrome c family protein
MAAVAAQRITDSHYTGSATSPAEYIHESIVDPPRYIVESYTSSSHPMPAYTHLTDQQIEALVQFLLQQ